MHLSEFFDCGAAHNWKESFSQLRCVIARHSHGELRLQNSNLHLNRIHICNTHRVDLLFIKL